MKYLSYVNDVYSLASSVVNNVVVAPVKTAVNVVTGGVTATVNTATNVVSTVTGGITSGVKATVGAFTSLSSGTVESDVPTEVSPSVWNEIKGVVKDTANLTSDVAKLGHHAISVGYVLGITGAVWFLGAGAVTTAAMFNQMILGIPAKTILGAITHELAPYALGTLATIVTAPGIWETIKDVGNIIKDCAGVATHSAKAVYHTLDGTFKAIYSKLVNTEEKLEIVDSTKLELPENKEEVNKLVEESKTTVDQKLVDVVAPFTTTPNEDSDFASFPNIDLESSLVGSSVEVQ